MNKFGLKVNLRRIAFSFKTGCLKDYGDGAR